MDLFDFLKMFDLYVDISGTLNSDGSYVNATLKNSKHRGICIIDDDRLVGVFGRSEGESKRLGQPANVEEAIYNLCERFSNKRIKLDDKSDLEVEVPLLVYSQR